ncbi:hypothetical protein G6L41_008795 [Agrobacterium tumefaciens]|uniref:hypothetical protein n=1 Tax=Agrobacterium TaxID=357 RepID=UPI00157421BD|nr:MULTISPECIES: hypothetical protein [Agrobacterium]WCK12367.1 hypothetical protein G6L41_008795 [Agrobacterium tumefaciens]
MWTSFDVLDSATLKASRDKFTGRLSEKIPLIFEDDFVRPDETETVRPTSQEERRDLKATVGRLLRQVGASNVAKESRVGEAHLSRYASPREKEFMPLDVLADVERMAGYPLVTEYMANLSGFDLVRNESEADAPDMEDVSRLADTKGKLLSALITSFLDGKIDNHERRTLLPLLDDAIAQMQELRSGLIGGGA